MPWSDCCSQECVKSSVLLINKSWMSKSLSMNEPNSLLSITTDRFQLQCVGFGRVSSHFFFTRLLPATHKVLNRLTSNKKKREQQPSSWNLIGDLVIGATCHSLRTSLLFQWATFSVFRNEYFFFLHRLKWTKMQLLFYFYSTNNFVNELNMARCDPFDFQLNESSRNVWKFGNSATRIGDIELIGYWSLLVTCS